MAALEQPRGVVSALVPGAGALDAQAAGFHTHHDLAFLGGRRTFLTKLPSGVAKRAHHQHGVSFRRFLLNYRIAMARDFLAEPHASISQVAYAVGFNDLSHFGRIFRRLVGEPATLYHQRVSRPRDDSAAQIDSTAQKAPI